MAKVGFWLRGSRGKLAGSSMSKGVNGNTIIREIVIPKNPRTDAQLYQRAIAATVMRAYSAGKIIFDHAFEGVQRGAKCMYEFQRLNMNNLRQLIAAEVSEGVAAADSQARVCVAGLNTPVPNRYIISSGSYGQNLFSFDNGFALPAATNAETVAAYAQRNGLVAGDIYTLVMFAVDKDYVRADVSPLEDTAYAKLCSCKFFFVRFIVKDGLAANTDAVATIGQLFTIEKSGVVPGITEATTIASTLNFATAFAEGKYTCGSIGMIRSRDNEDLRSNSVMEFIGESNFGIASPYILDAWAKQFSAISQSQLILEGGNF